MHKPVNYEELINLIAQEMVNLSLWCYCCKKTMLLNVITILNSNSLVPTCLLTFVELSSDIFKVKWQKKIRKQ